MSNLFKQRKWIVPAAMSLTLATVGVLAGCTPSDKGASDKTNAGKSPASDKPITVRFLVQNDPGAPMKNDMPWVKEFTKHTGVQFDWIAGPENADQYKEKFNLTIASGDIPDLMEGPGDMLIKGGDAGTFLAIDKYLDKMPNLKKLLDENPAYARALKTDNGRIYFLPHFLAVKTNNAFLVRQDWLDKLGLKQPQTPDEMYNVLKAFKEKDPNGNGKADEVPFTTRNKKVGLGGFVEPFGVSLEEDFIVENGKVGFTYTNAKMKDALAYLNKLFKEKLIDGEYATNDQKIWDQRLATEVAGMTWDVFARQDYFNKSIQQANKNANISMMNPLKGADGKQYTKSQQLPVGATGIAISAKSKNIEQLIQWADWFYSPEGQLAFNFGIEGDTYTLVNSQPQYTDKIVKDPKLAPGSVIKALGRLHFVSKLDIRYENASQSPEVVKKRDEVAKFVTDRFPKEYLSYTPEEREVINSKYTEISTFKDEMFDKFVYGAESLDKFDEFAAKINKMGLADVVKVQQAAYDRYMKR
ncbi:extracellular solute-binding protein [Paenibacillus rigui]|nr:extracellular solute-binding protein [Paenibacillus rigui]